MKYFFIILVVLIQLLATSTAHASSTTVNTTANGWIWRAMSEYDDPALPTGQGRAGGPGAYAAYTFSGSSISVAMMQGPTITIDDRTHRMGKVKVSLDGVSKTVANLYSSSVNADDIVFTTDALPAGIHVLELSAVDGWMVVDHLEMHSADPTGGQSSPGSFHDDFKNGDTSGWSTYGGDWTVVDGYYSTQPDFGGKALVTTSNFSDFVYQADIFVGALSAPVSNAGLIFRVQQPSVGVDAYSGYYAGIELGQQKIMLGKANNSWTLLTDVPFRVLPMTVYHMRIEAVGSQITVIINNLPVIHYTDDTYHSGAVGIRGFRLAAGWTHINVSQM